jgi:hypothetical protein
VLLGSGLVWWGAGGAQVYMHMHTVRRWHRVSEKQSVHVCPVHVCHLGVVCGGTECGRLDEGRGLGVRDLLQAAAGFGLCAWLSDSLEYSRSCMICPKRLGICAPARAWSSELSSVEYRCAVSTAGGALGSAVC